MWQDSISAAIVLAVFALSGMPGQEHTPEHTWDYGDVLGPSHWGDLKPDFVTCKTGHQQSPIDIHKAKKSQLPPLRFEYKPSSLHIVDNRHTVMVNYGPGSLLLVGEKKYALKQFHFHIPSEEEIEGKRFDMSAHLVHMDDNGKVAVVAVLLQQGAGNSLIHELWSALPKEKEKEEFFDDIQIDISKLLPSDRSYYTFQGSLTTPPCTESVTWFVMKHPIGVSAEEIQRFTQIYRNNARPIQPLYDRIVLESH